jgi:hypothetical protein
MRLFLKVFIKNFECFNYRVVTKCGQVWKGQLAMAASLAESRRNSKKKKIKIRA